LKKSHLFIATTGKGDNPPYTPLWAWMPVCVTKHEQEAPFCVLQHCTHAFIPPQKAQRIHVVLYFKRGSLHN
jgi:hypothetical protein